MPDIEYFHLTTVMTPSIKVKSLDDAVRQWSDPGHDKPDFLCLLECLANARGQVYALLAY